MVNQIQGITNIPPSFSSGEFNLIGDKRMSLGLLEPEEINKFIKLLNHGLKVEDERISDGELLNHFGNMFIDMFKKKYDIDDEQIIFLKSPTIQNFKLYTKIFPSKIAIIYRDGKNFVESYCKSANDKEDGIRLE